MIIGWISTLCLALCSLPLLIIAIREGKIETDRMFLWLWFIGEITGLVYTLLLGKYPLIANYGFNTIALVVIIYYNYFPRKEQANEQGNLRV